jgi:FkbM family methyltransferase
MFYSQFEQDKFIYETYFKDKQNGYFVDIGAHDGITLSNSKFFEDLGWDGICIEPNPKIFEILINNRKCKCVQKAISNKIGNAQFFQIIEGPDMLSGLVDEFTNTAITKINNELESSSDQKFDYIDVECDLFENIVDQTKIDFLSLDTEGNELKILRSINFNKFDIEIITVENNEYDITLPIPHSEFTNFLTLKGYEFITRLGCDEVYKKIKK